MLWPFSKCCLFPRVHGDGDRVVFKSLHSGSRSRIAPFSGNANTNTILMYTDCQNATKVLFKFLENVSVISPLAMHTNTTVSVTVDCLDSWREMQTAFMENIRALS